MKVLTKHFPTHLFLVGLLIAFEPVQADSISERINGRDFPSIFQPWNGVDDEPNVDKDDLIARHDLYFSEIQAMGGVRWNSPNRGLADGLDPQSIQAGLDYKEDMLQRNPNMVFLAELRYRDATLAGSFLPADHPWWLRDEDGEYIYGWREGNAIRLDFRQVGYQDRVAARAKALIDSGVVDGIMLDWWTESETEFLDARLSMLKKIREAIGPDALIMVNSNENTVPLSAEYVNGLFMESLDNVSAEHWQKTSETLQWAESNLRSPRINALETWYLNSREEYYTMRANTTLAMTVSNGYSLFADPNRLIKPDHEHSWYPFWNQSMGKPLAPGSQRSDGAWERQYENGVVVFNPPGNGAVEVTFDTPAYSVANEFESFTHSLNALDGDFYLDATVNNNVGDQTGGDAEAGIEAYSPPLDLVPGETYELSVPYTASGEQRIIATLQDKANDWATFGFGSVNVSQGTGTENISVTVDENAPIGVQYHWQVFIAPQSTADWGSRLSNLLIDGVRVTNGVQDSISAYTAPSDVVAGNRYDIEIPLSVSAEGTLHLTLQNKDDGWKTYGAATTKVVSGQKSSSLSVQVADQAPPGDNYVWQVFITPTGADWNLRRANLAKSSVNVR